MSKKYILKNGTAVEVSEEIYTYLKRSDWNNDCIRQTTPRLEKEKPKW